MPYIITIKHADGDEQFYGPDRTLVRFIDGAQRYDLPPPDAEVLCAMGYEADIQWVIA